MKLPNGFGTVVKLSGNRRNPYAARKTKGWNEKGHPIYEVIGYYPTREAGLIALSKYNESPWDLRAEKTTLAELFELWLEKKAHKLGNSNQISLKKGFRYCAALHDRRYKDIKAFHMQNVVDSCGCGHATQSQIKNMFYHLDRFALEIDLIERQYSGLVTVAPKPESDKHPFTNDEVQALWSDAAAPWVDTILIFLYSGWRISELLNLRRDDVDLSAGVMRGGLKTKAGRGRIVPIHTRILPIIEERHSFGGDYLICTDKTRPLPGETYRYYWANLMKRFGIRHATHECRHTFCSRLDSAGANKVCIDLLMGHKSESIGERIYTHKTIEELKNTIELVTY